ncbi:MAG: hypothetical protein EKK63_18265 [Acinetobacter sp.]|uniref:hypothetical protein n=1 Tax=Acinetobacter sp. TaxID=472 RepID=UPI000FC21EAE|nr:hypothetical protein [Acinetobacter sp.]RUP36172.1 MAG: hypothetical protein EKK63_18265 [Acinetobacter sp.]
MKNKIMGLIFQKGIVLFNITILVNVIMIYAAKAYIEPSIKYTFQYILNNISTEYSAQEILNHYGTGDKILEPVAVVITIFRSFLLLYIYIYIITSASALIAFRSSFRINSFFLRKQNYNLQKNTSFFYEIKLISTWVALYSLCNFAMQGLGLSDFWYKQLAILSQALMFYLLFINSPISCTITQKSKELPRIIFEFDTQNSIHQNIVPQFVVRASQLSDTLAMVLLSKAKRLAYEKAQPQFWCYAGEEGDIVNQLEIA